MPTSEIPTPITIEQRMERLERLVLHMAPQREPVWITGKELAKMTGWGPERMRSYRENCNKKDIRRYGKNSVKYNLNSIHPKYLL